MELELTNPLLPGSTKNINLSSVITDISEKKTEFDQLKAYFNGLPPTRNVLSGHTESLNRVKVSPDGKLIATAALDSKVRVWDLQEKTLIKEFTGHTGYVRRAEFTPDSRFLFSGDTQGNIFMWNLETLEQEAQFEGLKCEVNSLKVSPNGKYLLAGGRDFLIKAWNLEDRTEKYTLDSHTNIVVSLEISKDNKYLVSGSHDYSVKIWDLEEGKELYEYTHEGSLCIVVISDDDKYVASAGWGFDVKIWSLGEKQLVATIKNHADTVYGLAISSDSKYLASGSADKTVRLWNIAHSKEQAVFKGHSSTINSLVFTSDGKYLASGAKDNTIRLWNMKEMKLESELTGHFWEVIDLAISPDNKYLISASLDKTARIWNLETTKEYAVIDSGSSPVINLSVSGNGKIISSISEDGIVAMYAVETLSELVRSEQKASCSAFTSDCRYFAGATSDYKIILVELGTEQEYELGSHNDEVTCLIFSSDISYLISGSLDSLIKIFSVETHEQESVLEGHSSYIRCLAISQDSRYLISGSEDNTVRVWNFKKRIAEYVIEGQFDPIYSVTITSNNKFITYGSLDAKVRVWNHYDKRHEVILEGHTEGVQCMAITSDDKYLVSASYDSTRIWNLREMKQEKLLSTCNFVKALEITKDCKFLISGNDDGKIRLWDLTDCIAEYGLVSEHNYEIKGHDYSFEKEVFINAVKRAKNVKYMSFMDKMLIMPIKVNPLHLYAYYNDTSLMAEALKSGCNFINTRYGESPITICLRKNSRKCLDLLLEYIINLGATNEAKQSFIIESITNDIPDLIQTSSKHLVDFLSILTKKSDPIFIRPMTYLPMTRRKNDCSLDPDEFEIRFLSKEDDDTLVEILSTRFRWNIERGSNDSIKLMESILNTPVEKIYRTDLVKSLIDYKWNDLYAINLTFTLLYLLNLICLIAVVFYGNSEPLVNTACSGVFIGINIFLFLYELYQSITTGASYFLDVWNYLDIIRSPICITWGIFSLTQSSGDLYDVMTFFTNLLCWIRGLTYFRTFKPTRVFVRMVLGVFKDTASFLIVLTYTTLAYGTLFAASSNSNTHNFVESMKSAYLFDLANFETQNITNSQWVVFFIASIINCIIMLNLLISILGDSYGKIQETMIESDYSQMIEVILELEKLMIWNRQKGEKIYLQICKEFEDGDDGKEIESHVKDLNKRLDALSQKFEAKSQETETLLRDIHEKVSKIAASS